MEKTFKIYVDIDWEFDEIGMVLKIPGNTYSICKSISEMRQMHLNKFDETLEENISEMVDGIFTQVDELKEQFKNRIRNIIKYGF